MYRFWSCFFATVPIFAISLSYWCHENGMWLPKNVSTFGGDIDELFNTILLVTSIVFVICNLLLVVFMWKYADKQDGRRAIYTHGSHKLEIAWTLLTAALLGFIAFSQTGIWIKIKFPESSADIETIARVTARQFEWRITYPGPDGKFDTLDDVRSTSILAFPINKRVKIMLESQDVLHSFFLPNLRVKQDAVPGMKTPVWFEATEAGDFDLVCAELCGWGHYKMKGKIKAMTPEAYDDWYENLVAEQNRASTD